MSYTENLKESGWPTTEQHATGHIPVRVNLGTPNEATVEMPVTSNPDFALAFGESQPRPKRKRPAPISP